MGRKRPFPPCLPHFEKWTPLAQAQFLEITVFMAEYLLSSQGDRVAMAHSIEGRFPFLDHRVMEFAISYRPITNCVVSTERVIL
ncbi:MAG: asparagine synthase C-terminal domain-containing protein [Chloroflexi bacterium]|nr:asparagine synthase C-terminal domain-containing protein [Chloroflexota bacterium]